MNAASYTSLSSDAGFSDDVVLRDNMIFPDSFEVDEKGCVYSIYSAEHPDIEAVEDGDTKAALETLLSDYEAAKTALDTAIKEGS